MNATDQPTISNPLPTQVKIIDVMFSIVYYDKPSDVDFKQRESLWGQLDPWTHTIRIYARENHDVSEVWNTIWHEIVHAICLRLKIKPKTDKLIDDEDATPLLATGINAVLRDNAWIKEVMP